MLNLKAESTILTTLCLVSSALLRAVLQYFCFFKSSELNYESLMEKYMQLCFLWFLGETGHTAHIFKMLILLFSQFEFLLFLANIGILLLFSLNEHCLLEVQYLWNFCFAIVGISFNFVNLFNLLEKLQLSECVNELKYYANILCFSYDLSLC